MKFFGIIVILALILSSTSFAQTTLSFTTADNQNHHRAKAMNAVLIECFKRMGIVLNIVKMPSKRSLKNADNGLEDGNFVRTEGITHAYPNLIKVPEKISVNRIVAFSKNTNIKIKNWQSLSKFNVVCVNGWRNCERELDNPNKVTYVKNEELLMTLIENDRTDIGIFGQSTGFEVIKKLGYSSIKSLEPPVAVSDLFLYIHKKHLGLIDAIVKTLKEMKNDGTYKNLIKDRHNKKNDFEFKK